MNKDIAKMLVAGFQKAGATDVIAKVTEQQASHIKFSNSKINAIMEWNITNLELFVAIGKKTVTTSVKDFSESAVNDTIKQLVKFAKASPGNDDYYGIAKGPFQYKEIENIYDPNIAELGDADVNIVKNAINISKKIGAPRCAGVMESSVSKGYILTSNNCEGEYGSSNLYFSFRAFAAKNASGHQVTVSKNVDDLNSEKVAKDAAETAVAAKNPVDLKAGKYDVLFEPLPSSNLLENLGSSASIFYVESGLSCLGNKIGTRVASDKVNLIDDATLPGGFASAPFDEEGRPSQRNVLIDKGILSTYLHNTSSAYKYKTESTSNAGIIAPEPTNLILETGNLNKEDLISSIRRGLIITNLWYTRFQNYETGDFSTIPRDAAFFVENGKITKSVEGFRISDNLLNLMKNVKEVGGESQPIKGWEVELPVVTPPILIKNVNITKPLGEKEVGENKT